MRGARCRCQAAPPASMQGSATVRAARLDLASAVSVARPRTIAQACAVPAPFPSPCAAICPAAAIVSLEEGAKLGKKHLACFGS